MNHTDNVVAMACAKAVVRACQVVYCLDVMRPKTVAEAIPLGVFVDLRVPNRLYGLGLIARSTVSDEELRRVGELARPIVSDPYGYLVKEFERVIDADDPHTEFSNLPNVHSTALMVSPWKNADAMLPRHLRVAVDDDGPLQDWASDTVKGKLLEEFWSLLDEHWPEGDLQKRIREKVKLAA